MGNLLQRIGLCAIFLVVVASQSSAQTDIESERKLCENYVKRMENYADVIFGQLAKVQSNKAAPPISVDHLLEVMAELGVNRNLAQIAALTGEYLYAVENLLSVYEMITKADRVRVKPSIKRSFDGYIEEIGFSIRLVNENLLTVS